ncbi:MAG: thioredoxin family protein [Firmicutes bacterium]|nr:thioredoxin family protein [Bacillota bacterium]MDD4263047.1 thioredoxin family protein [Bacillota bacterium]MDD4692804.1 thioredoxin family protein [Bacillota bacterium]
MEKSLDIRLLGACCSGNCSVLERNLVSVLEELNIDYKLERIDDLASIVNYGCLEVPGIVINGHLVSQGNILSKEQLREFVLSLDFSKRDSD